MVNYEAIFRSLEILPKVGGVLSIIGSTLLARHIIKAKKRWWDVSLTNKMLFWISIVNLISSFFVFFMSSWMVPRGSYGFDYAAGTTGTCTTQGFFLVFSMTYFATAYTALAVLYWLIVHRGWTNNQMEQRRIRFSFLLTPVFVALCFAVPPLFFQMYNGDNDLNMCFLDPYPYNCYEPDVECIRGSVEGVLLAQCIIYGYMLLGNIVVIIFIGLLIFAVFRKEKKADRYLAKGLQKNRNNTRSTAWQGVRFSAAYLIPYFMFYVALLRYLIFELGGNADESDAALIFTLYWVAIVTPMLGAFNSAVYFYPRYATHRKQNPEKSRMACLYEVLGLDIGWLLGRERPEMGISGASASTPLICEDDEEDIQIVL